MSRNLYLLSAVLLVFALGSFGMSWTPSANHPGLPGVAQMWRMISLALFVLGTLACLSGTVINLFEQVSRRHDERQRRERKQE